jgi:hypothetical protein
MLSYILKEFKGYNQNICAGLDGMYHTVYYILFETGQYYVGKHSTFDLSDKYFCSSNLANQIKNKGLKYNRTVLFYAETSENAIELETKILSNKKIYENTNCLNCYPGSPPDLTGTIIVSLNNKFKMINPKLLDYYLEQGWERKGIKRIWVNNGNNQKNVLPEEVENYTNLGWNIGTLEKHKNRIFIYKNGERKFIDKQFLNEFLKEGWVKKHNVEDTKVLRKGERIIKVKPEKVSYYLSEGFIPSSTVEGLIYIKKEKEYKRVKKSNLTNYLNNGWTLGNNVSGMKYINNGTREKRIFLDDLPNYPGWQLGRIKKVYLNNGTIERRIMPYDMDIINNLKQQGYIKGPLLKRK